jgi:tetratricopeptide (TPR) repeat protein
MLRSTPRLLIPFLAASLLTGCERFSARLEFKKANGEYKNENYRSAIESYQRGLRLDPNAKRVWRSLGLAAMAVYRPGDNSPSNLDYAKTAIEAFDNYLQAYPDDSKVSEYLLTTLLNSEQYDAALKRLEAAGKANPTDMKIEEGIVSVLLKAKRLDEAAARVARMGARATYTMNYSVGVYCWDKAYRDPMLDPVSRGKVVETGIGVLKRAVEMQPETFEANVYYNLILREKAKLEPDPDKQQAIYAEALKYQDKAKAIAAAKKAAAGG